MSPARSVSAAQVRTLAEAAQVLGWKGQLRWPVVHVRTHFAVVCDAGVDPAAGPAGGWVIGCLRPGREAAAVRRCSLLAGYARRAVVMPDNPEVLAALIDATVLDVGLVVAGQLLAPAGPVVPSHWTRPGVPADPSWLAFAAAVLTAPDHGSVPIVPPVSNVDGHARPTIGREATR
jgi:hypothetical protein